MPRGEYPNPYRERNEHVNTFLINNFANNQNDCDHLVDNVHVIPVHENIIRGDQTISHHVMHDYLHLTNNGYTKIFTPVYEKLKALLDKQ